MEDFEFILEFKKLKSVGKVCKELGIDYPNLVNQKTSKENERKVANELRKQVINLYNNIILKEVLK